MKHYQKPRRDSPRVVDLFLRRATTVVALVACAMLILLVIWFAIDVFLLVFGGILFAIFLCSLSDLVSWLLHLSRGWSLAIVGMALVSLIGLGATLLAPEVVMQVNELSKSLPGAVQQLQQRVERYDWVRQLFDQLSAAGDMVAGRTDVLSSVTSVFSTTFGAILDVLIVLFVGVYLAAEPEPYLAGLVRLVPVGKRERAREVIAALGHTLHWWLLGRAFEMIVVGALTATGLWLLGVPMALTLGLLAALLEFVPNLGPILAAVPSVLLALSHSPTQTLYVILLYIGIQTVESYLLTPLVERRTVLLPPVLTIAAQMLMGMLLGGLGLVLAPPLTATLLVLVKMLYVEDLLGDVLAAQDERHTVRPKWHVRRLGGHDPSTGQRTVLRP